MIPIQSIIAQLEHSLHFPQQLHVHVAIWTSAIRKFGDIRIIGCNFHFRQSIWKNIQKLGEAVIKTLFLGLACALLFTPSAGRWLKPVEQEPVTRTFE